MPLRIEISKHKGQPVERRPPFVINEDGGSIGRGVGNTIVLADESVSRGHARISFENGCYYLIDDSSNGTLIFNRDVFIQGGEAELIDGDILRIGDFELKVSITESEESPLRMHPLHGPPPESSVSITPDAHVLIGKKLSIDDYFKDTDEGEFKESKPASYKKTPSIVKDEKIDSSSRESGAGERLNDLDKLFKKIDDAPPLADTAFDLREDEASRLSVHRDPVPPAAKSPPSDLTDGVLDTDWFPGDRQTSEEVCRELLERFLRGAEIEDPGFLNAAELPEFIEVLGAVFREMVNGLWRILRGRSELKAEMRLAMTMVRPTGNNPLKFSPRLEDAVKSLIKKGHPSFLEPLEAVTDGFDDIMNHELALHAGMQASLAESLSHFDPECFNEKNKHGSIMQTKGHLWKAYCEAYPELREAAMDGVFGKAFAGAYEDQLAKLRSQRKKD